MNKKTIVILLITHGLAGIAGFFVARTLLAKDPAWEAENQKQQETQIELDAALSSAGNTPVRENEAGSPPGEASEDEANDAAPSDASLSKTANFLVDAGGKSRVAFTSDAPLESIVGTTSNVSGSFRVPLGDVTQTEASTFQVPIRTLRTGIDLRDEHLQGENWMDAENHPNAIFTLKRVESAQPQLSPHRTISAKLHGTLSIRGIDVPVVVDSTLGYFPWTPDLERFGIQGNVLRVKGSFEVRLSDYDMSAGVVGHKVAEIVSVSLHLTAVEQDTPNP